MPVNRNRSLARIVLRLEMLDSRDATNNLFAVASPSLIAAAGYVPLLTPIPSEVDSEFASPVRRATLQLADEAHSPSDQQTASAKPADNDSDRTDRPTDRRYDATKSQSTAIDLLQDDSAAIASLPRLGLWVDTPVRSAKDDPPTALARTEIPVRPSIPAAVAPAASQASSPVGTAGDGVAGRLNRTASAMDEDDSEPPPNVAPVAADDAATVIEDGAVEVSVLANDTDSDIGTEVGDNLHIAYWDSVTPNGLVTQPTDGVLLYTPDPDFHGVDVFSYTVADDADEESTATVTVTVTPVNDICIAFDDAYQARPYVGVSGVVLNNDIDFDHGYSPHGTLQVDVGSVNTSGMEGDLTILADGRFWWYAPNDDWSGVTSFKYSITDGVGSGSTATCTIIMPDPGILQTPWVTTSDDAYPVGDDPVSHGSVLTNDTGGDIAVLVSHPAAGRLTSFGTDGSFSYTPQVGGGDQTFGYKVFNFQGGPAPAGTVTIYTVDLDIWNGQNGNQLASKEEKARGAVTVVNKNDTDNDGTPDVQDNLVVAQNPNLMGENEKDLMRVSVKKPNDPNMGANKVKLTLTGSAKLWQHSTKQTEVVLTNGSVEVDFPPGETSREFWVEVTDTNAKLRSITVEAEYRGKKAQVKATGVWVNFAAPGGFKNTGTGDGARPVNADDKDFKHAYAVQGKLGAAHNGFVALKDIIPGAPRPYLINNVMIMEFSVVPANAVQALKIVADVSRVKTFKTWHQPNGGQLQEIAADVSFPVNKDIPDDDASQLDEDNLPKSGFIYSLDVPGTTNPGNGTARIKRSHNMFEFVSILIPNATVSTFYTDPVTKRRVRNGRLEGSRASDHIAWRSRSDFTRFGNKDWRRTADTVNEIRLDHTPLGD